MANGANGVHLQLREALEDYIKSQYFGKSPILLSAVQNKLDQEGILYQKPYIESSPAYKSELNGIQKSSKLPDWVKAYFDALANADLGVHSSPFCHQVEALEAAFAGKDLFVSTGTGSGKTECFMWPLLAKLAAEARNSGDSSKKTFLDALYEEGIIPTYSFPKNVVSTYISGIDGKVKYQVERGLDVAIGEYAPGRAIVVDKTTYQIGGLYYPGGGRTEQTAYSPARAFIQDASYCKNISTCTECGWFGLDEDHPHKCPFCGNDKLTHMLPMLRPWGFAPRDAKAIEQAQLSEEYTATQQPLYSTLPDADDVVAIKGYSNTRMAVRPNQRIIMLNKGIGDKGFTICCDCGAAMPGDDPSVLKDIMRPYRSKFLRTRCKHNETKNVNLGYDFITDMLVLEIALDRQQVSMDLAKNSWLNRAGQSLAEALRLSACQELDIEFTELVTGFRVRQNQKGDFIDIYLYDSLSSGAGYAVSIEASIQQLLIKTRELLSSCNCDSACHKCLKHYRNQYVHGLLDRSAALDLLTWAEKGVRSPMLPVYEQRNSLQSVEQILQFSGVHIDFDHEPIEAESFHGKKRIVVYPAMWARPTEKNMVFVSDSYLKYAKPYALKTIVGGL